MKQMEYKPEIVSPIILDEGNFDGFGYLILSFGTHPAAYVRIPSKHQYYKKHCDDIDIDCHGGLTFSGESPDIEPCKSGWWIGWDYAHYKDYLGFFTLIKNMVDSDKTSSNEKKWTTLEIKAEVENVIKQLRMSQSNK